MRRASLLFDKVIVLVSSNPNKSATFSTEQRVDFLRRAAAKLERVEIDANDGLLISYFNKRKADVIIKGLRAMSDFDYEFQMALVNKDMCHKAETVFFAADAASTFLSSSMVKQIASFGGDISAFVPSSIAGEITDVCRAKRKKPD
jgi:pantetheine-phosphate adenylyltransferase